MTKPAGGDVDEAATSVRRIRRRGADLGLGCVGLGSLGRDGVRLVHHALDLGVRFFDTADAYGAGGSEKVLGRALRRRRHEAVVATKGGYLFRERSALRAAPRSLAPYPVAAWLNSLRHTSGSPSRAYASKSFSPAYLRTALEASLRRLETDTVDLYQLHGPRAVDDDIIALMLDLRAEGKIRAFGVGLEGLSDAADWIGTGALDSMLVPFGVLDPDAGRRIIPEAAARDISVHVRGVLAGGFVAKSREKKVDMLRPGQHEVLDALRAVAESSGFSTRQIAIWYATAHPDVSRVLVGTSSSAHLDQAVRDVETPPEPMVMRIVDALVSDGYDAAERRGVSGTTP